MTKANNGVFEPEMRLPSCIFFAFFIPITFFWYGWTADKGVYVSKTRSSGITPPYLRYPVPHVLPYSQNPRK